MNQFFVFYACLTCTQPIAMAPANDLSQDECVSLAKRHTESFGPSGPYVKCETRGPNDMIWRFHPEWKQ